MGRGAGELRGAGRRAGGEGRAYSRRRLERVAAAVLLQGMTAQYLATGVYAVRPGDDVLVHAAAGGVGLLLTQIIKALGGRVIATTSGGEKAELARERGRRRGDRLRGLRRASAGAHGRQGAAVVYDGVGQATFDESLASLRERGTMVLYGAASGPVPPFDPMRLEHGGSLFLTRPSDPALHGRARGAPRPRGGCARAGSRRGSSTSGSAGATRSSRRGRPRRISPPGRRPASCCLLPLIPYESAASASPGTGTFSYVTRLGRLLPLVAALAIPAAEAANPPQVAFMAHSNRTSLMLLDQTGDGARELTLGKPGLDSLSTYSWSPDGSRVVYTTAAPDANLHILGVDDGGPHAGDHGRWKLRPGLVARRRPHRLRPRRAGSERLPGRRDLARSTSQPAIAAD